MSDSTIQKIAIHLREIAAEMDKASEHIRAVKNRRPWEKAITAIQVLADDLEVASQEPTSQEGSAGTHAYDMLAAMGEREVETTETLIHMVAATVLARIIHRDERGPVNSVTFSPGDMDAMYREYEITVTRDGIDTTVSVSKRNEPVLGLALSPGIDETEPAKPQAKEHVYDKPYWFAKIGPERVWVRDQSIAEALVKRSLMLDPTIVAEVENRMCGRADCQNPDNQGVCSACSTI